MQQNCSVGTRLHAMVGRWASRATSARPGRWSASAGLGVAPVYPQARAYKDSGAYVIGVLGFRNKGLMFWKTVPRLLRRADRLHRRRFGRHQGPGDEGIRRRSPLMPTSTRWWRSARDHDEGVRRSHAPHGIKTMVSLNPVMVDGTGMCGGCRVKIGEQVKFACVDGPDFDGHQSTSTTDGAPGPLQADREKRARSLEGKLPHPRRRRPQPLNPGAH